MDAAVAREAPARDALGVLLARAQVGQALCFAQRPAGRVPPAPAAALAESRRSWMAQVRGGLSGQHTNKLNKLVAAGSAPADAAPYIISPHGVEHERCEAALPFRATQERLARIASRLPGVTVTQMRREINYVKEIYRRSVSVTLLHYNTRLYNAMEGRQPQWEVTPAAEWARFPMVPEWVA